jgi:hypothetical protein
MSIYFSGLDLGQVRDYTAMAVVELDYVDDAPLCRVRHLERFTLGTKYTAIADCVEKRMEDAPLLGSELIVDHTGVGRGVVDTFRERPALAHLHAVTITGGEKESRDGNDWRVPKRDLVGVVQVLLQSGRLKIAPQLREARTLTEEMSAFQVKITDAGNDTYGAWRENQHDDLVLAVALSCWAATHKAFGRYPGAFHPGAGVKGWG